LEERSTFVVAAALAAAIGVAELFQHLRRSNPAAGRRAAGLSLWRPDIEWTDKAAVGPNVSHLPSDLWLIGLGNLGQAYLWMLGLLPYADPADVRLVLQDFDILTDANDSTSLLTQQGLVGLKKTRSIASWAEGRGFRTAIVERRFGLNLRVTGDEPWVALCGVDNGEARAALEEVGFERVIEAGLGKGVSDYLALRCHTFPSSRTARAIWGDRGVEDAVTVDAPAYRALQAAGMDRCGLTQLAGRTVGAPFVGAVAAALVIAEATRLAIGAHRYELVDGHLRNLDHLQAVRGIELPPFNPGITASK
jgi:hypothetical protein